MIDYIHNIKDFKKIKSNLNTLLNEKTEIESNPFNNNFNLFIAFDFDFIFDKLFFENLKEFLKKMGIDNFYFYTINPSPEKYFFKYFDKFNVLKLNLSNTNEQLSEIMMRNPKDSPVDALALNSNDIVWFSNSKDWAIIGSRDLEIAIVGFTNLNVKKIFLSSFDDNIDMFHSIDEQVNNLDELIEFDDSQKEIYSILVKSYSSRP